MTEEKVTYNQPVIECFACHNMKHDEDGKAHRFGTRFEKEWWVVSDTTGYCTTRVCKGQYCNPCLASNFYNPGRKMMFCLPTCYLKSQGHPIHLTKQLETEMLKWCDDHLGYNRDSVKLEIVNTFMQ